MSIIGTPTGHPRFIHCVEGISLEYPELHDQSLDVIATHPYLD